MFKQFFLFFFGSLLLILSGCQRSERDEYPETHYIDLNTSAKIILNLIHTGELKKVLQEDATANGIDLLIKNFSPSELAFEAEVLNAQIPVVVVFVKDTKNSDEIKKIMNKLAEENKDKIRFVLVDSEILFKLTEHSEVDIFPTISLIHERDEKKRIESFDIATLESQIRQLIKETNY